MGYFMEMKSTIFHPRVTSFARPLLLFVFAMLILSSHPVEAMVRYESAAEAFSGGRYDVALHDFRQLAEGGHQGAEFMIGVMYFQGRGVAQNRAIAAVWFHKAALKGHEGAQLALGSIHIRGVGVYQDLSEAYMWLSLAKTSSSTDIRDRANILLRDAARLMTRDEIAGAENTAAGFESVRSGLTIQD